MARFRATSGKLAAYTLFLIRILFIRIIIQAQNHPIFKNIARSQLPYLRLLKLNDNILIVIIVKFFFLLTCSPETISISGLNTLRIL